MQNEWNDGPKFAYRHEAFDRRLSARPSALLDSEPRKSLRPEFPGWNPVVRFLSERKIDNGGG